MINEHHEKKKELAALIALSKGLLADIRNTVSSRVSEPATEPPGTLFFASYQKWYSQACEFVSRVLPGRLSEFEFLYMDDPKRKSISRSNYSIRHWLLDVRLSAGRSHAARVKEYSEIVENRFHLQCLILESAEVRFNSSLFSISPAVIDFDKEAPEPVIGQKDIRALIFLYDFYRTSGTLMFHGPEAQRFPEILREGLKTTWPFID